MILTSSDLKAYRKPLNQSKKIIDWLKRGESAMVFSKSGVGKTLFCLSLALSACHSRNFLSWNTDKNKCLYVDGEMQQSTMIERIKEINGDIPENFYFLSHENSEEELYLENKDIQNLLINYCEKKSISLLVLDNLSTLSKSNRNSAQKFMNEIAPFIRRCRRKNISVILVHHAGKNGKQAGSHANDITIDVCIKLDRNKDESITGTFEKSRNLKSERHKEFRYIIKNKEDRLIFKLVNTQETTTTGDQTTCYNKIIVFMQYLTIGVLQILKAFLYVFLTLSVTLLAFAAGRK